jgi:hypothetical protein
MKKIIFILLFIPIVSVFSQTITIQGISTFNTPVSLLLIGSDGGTPARNIYSGTFWIPACFNNTGIITVQWNNTINKWEIISNVQTCTPMPCHTSNFASYPNPPDDSVADFFDACGSGGISFTGTGTQSTLLSTDNFDVSQIEIKISPNPIIKEFTVYGDKKAGNNFVYKIVDLTGRTVKNGDSKFNEQINVESLTSGNYIIQIETENGKKFAEKLVKN